MAGFDVGALFGTEGSAGANAAQGFDWSKFLQSDQFSNLLGAGTGLFGAYQADKALDKQFDIADQSMAMSQDVFQRDKDAEERRRNLNFA